MFAASLILLVRLILRILCMLLVFFILLIRDPP